MNRIFIDMDGVLVDWPPGLTGAEAKTQPGIYLSMPPMPGALDAVRSLIGMGYEVWAATKPPTGVAFAYADKAQWIFDHLPELKRRIIITHDRGLLGDVGDFLIDDRPHKANCGNFLGRLIVFGAPKTGSSAWTMRSQCSTVYSAEGLYWPEILEWFRANKPKNRA